jgi:hypothetical protein
MSEKFKEGVARQLKLALGQKVTTDSTRINE